MADKKCKHCAMMIPDEAKVCPHCRKNQPMPVKIWQIAGLLLFMYMVYSCASTPSTQDYKAKAEEQTTKAENAVQLTAKGQKVKDKHNGWSNEVCNAVGDKKIFVGMTREQVKAAWGKPHKINTSIYSNHESEQWVMHELGSDYVYFDDGIMTSLQQSK